MKKQVAVSKGKLLIIGGFVSISALFFIYSKIQNPSLTPEVIVIFERIAALFYIVLLMAFGAIAYGLYQFHKQKVSIEDGSIMHIIALSLNSPKSKKIFVITFIVYGIFFSFSSGILVYQPEVVFSYHYDAIVPSAHLTPCCGDPGYMPKFVAYITEHVGLQIIPVNLVLQLVVSYLVALNVALAFNAVIISKKSGGLSGLGAITGLFIACPTCVGTFLSLFVGTTSAVVFTLAITQLQTLFIAITIPVLLATPFIIARKIDKFSASCPVTESK